NFLAGEGKRYAGFTLMMRTTAGAPIEEGGRIAGLRASDDNGALEIRADLVIGADGRHSTVRDSIGAAVQSLGAPMDVLWFRLTRWYRDGLLCIGDAAHAMSPIGGVGINLAIQDAVAAANLLAAKLRARRVATDDLRRVQRRREFPTRWTQRLQLFIQDRVI